MTPKKIGLTGGIGSGKSFIANLFALMKIPIYDSDRQAKFLMINDLGLVEGIKKEFGKKAYNKDGTLNRPLISEQIFKDKERLESINKLVHPAVRKDFKKWSESQKDCPYVINEAALFVENGSYKTLDALISVVSPLELRVARVLKRDLTDRQKVLARMNNQSSDDDKMKVSDFIIYNDEVCNLLQQISKVHQSLIRQ